MHGAMRSIVVVAAIHEAGGSGGSKNIDKQKQRWF